MEKRSLAGAPGVAELKKKKHRSFRKKTMVFLILFIVLVIGLVFVSRAEKLNIDKIIVSGASVLDPEAIKEIAQKNLNGDYFGVFPKTNFIIYPQRKIKNELLATYPRIQKIIVNNLEVKTLEIEVIEYTGEYIWCGTIMPELDSRAIQSCYFMDENGYLFDESPYFSGDVYFKFYGNLSNENILGNYFYPEYFKQLIYLKDSIEQMGLKSSYFSVNNQGDAILSLAQSSSGRRPIIMIKLDSDYQKMIENLQSAITAEPLLTKIQKNYSSLQYIDLRYGNKVYYKFE